MNLSTRSEKPNKPNIAGLIPYPKSSSPKVERMEYRSNYSSFLWEAIGCLCILLLVACSSAPMKKAQAEFPGEKKSEIQKEDEKVPAFEDLRGYLYPGRKTPRTR